MAQHIFGAGSFFVIKPGTPPQPLQLLTLQETSISFQGSLKDLRGRGQYAEQFGRGAVKVTGKSKFARVNAQVYNAIFFNQTVATGMTIAAVNEAGTVPASTPFTVTVANSTTFKQDYGVLDALTGKQLTPVASAPTTGQYLVANGEYTFAAADTGKAIYLSYLYTTIDGYTINLSQQDMGAAPTFQGLFNGRFSGKQTTMMLNSCVSSKLDLIGTKLEDWTIPEFDFEAGVDFANNLGFLSTNE